MTQLPTNALPSSARLVLLLILTAAMVLAFAGAISDPQFDGLRAPGEPIQTPGAGLGL